jgi:DNA-binding NarL/FixJ family response regulator
VVNFGYQDRPSGDLRATTSGTDLVRAGRAETMAIRVHLADDHTMFRAGLEAILASHEGVEVVGASPTGEEAATMIARSRPDLVVTQLDMDLREAEGILKGIRRASPDSKIVVLTMFDNPRYVRALSGMGVDAYVHKGSSAEELIVILNTLSRRTDGRDAVISMPRGALERMDAEPKGGLTEREMEVLVLAGRGLSNRRIAEKLHLAEATVKRHLANVYEKIGVHSRTGATRKAMIEEWVGLREIIQEPPSAAGPGRNDTPGG